MPVIEEVPSHPDPVTLNDSNLAAIKQRGAVAAPDYDRTGLTAGIVHIGVGGFHRAHQAMVIDDLLRTGLARNWAICGVGVLEQDRRMSNVMRQQDELYTLVLKHPDGRHEARIIGSIVEYLLAAARRTHLPRPHRDLGPRWSVRAAEGEQALPPDAAQVQTGGAPGHTGWVGTPRLT